MPDDKSPNQDGDPQDNPDKGKSGSGGDEPQSLWEILNPADQDAARDSTQESTDTPADDASGTDDSSQISGEGGRELHPEDYIPQDSSMSTPAPTDASRIQRILTNPDAVDEAVAQPAEAGEGSDFDSAVRSFIERDSLTVNCRTHADRQAVDNCPECEAYYCQECMVVRRGRLLCRDCSETLFTPTEEEIIRSQEMGMDLPKADIAPEDPPEFEVGGSMFGTEGRPASPFKRIVALLIDLAITRGIYIGIFFLLGTFFGSNPSPAFHLFDNEEGLTTSMRVVNAMFLFKPPLPWLIIIAVFDFLYFFGSLSFTNRTAGMSWMGCRIVTEWGDFVPFGAIALRTLVFMVFLGIPAVLLAFFFPAYRGPHDYVAGTVVINYSGVKRIDAYENIQIKL